MAFKLPYLDRKFRNSIVLCACFRLTREVPCIEYGGLNSTPLSSCHLPLRFQRVESTGAVL
uniref:Uncharacterized protein n=1 Tax=Utricularia reniformis TaxID=192314 RepID=A0A1Y0B1W5_9LAMI|nr:hypothetical protein AEK19_MT1164 [Utricularia reniformis]ART31378.1 hypothetical protein AEK19_MT1164 [Utricularia reniformis]